MLNKINFYIVRPKWRIFNYFITYMFVGNFFRHYLIFKAEKPFVSDADRYDNIAIALNITSILQENDNGYVLNLNVVPFRSVPIILLNIPLNV